MDCAQQQRNISAECYFCPRDQVFFFFFPKRRNFNSSPQLLLKQKPNISGKNCWCGAVHSPMFQAVSAFLQTQTYLSLMQPPAWTSQPEVSADRTLQLKLCCAFRGCNHFWCSHLICEEGPFHPADMTVVLRAYEGYANAQLTWNIWLMVSN